MTDIKKYLLMAIPVFAILLLILLKNTGTGHFRYDAGKLAAASIDGSNIVSGAKLKSLGNDALLVILDRSRNPEFPFSGRVVSISADSLFSANNLKIIKGSPGTVVLLSGDESVSARAWMTLSQAGIKKLFILSHGMEK